MNNQKIKLSLIVPCFNEEKNVQAFFATVEKSFKECNFGYEYVFVDDGSKDNTFKELKKLYTENKDANITAIRFSRNFGKEAAMFAGLNNVQGEYVCIIDADLQQSPEVVKEMVRMLDNNEEIDCVAAYQKERHESKLLVFFKAIFYKLINYTSDIEFVPGASDFRTFRKKMANSILELQEKYRFSKGIFSWIGYNTYIEYEAQERFAGTSKWSFRKLFKYAIDGIIAFTTTPLKIATVLGSITSVVALLYFIWILVQKLVWGIAIPGYPTLVCLILLLGGIQLVMLGIIGEYLGRVYIEGKNRPIFIAKDILKKDDMESNTD